MTQDLNVGANAPIAPDLKDQIVSEIKAFVHQEIETLNGKFETLNGKFETLNEKFETLNGRFETLAQDVQQTKNEIIKWVVGVAFGTFAVIATSVGLYTAMIAFIR